MNQKISSTSNIGIASTNIELYNDVDTKKVLQEIKDEINKPRLPEDAEDPIVTEISTNNEIMFQMVLYGPQYKYPKTSLIEFAKSIKHSLEVPMVSQISQSEDDLIVDLEHLVCDKKNMK